MRPVDCGGCKGQGAHSRRCHTMPGGHWYRLEDAAKELGDHIGSNDIEAANMAYSIAGRMRTKALAATDGRYQATRRTWAGPDNDPVMRLTDALAVQRSVFQQLHEEGCSYRSSDMSICDCGVLRGEYLSRLRLLGNRTSKDGQESA